MTRDEVSCASGVLNGGAMSKYLKVLEQCGFIRKFTELGRKTKGSVFQLIETSRYSISGSWNLTGRTTGITGLRWLTRMCIPHGRGLVRYAHFGSVARRRDLVYHTYSKTNGRN